MPICPRGTLVDLTPKYPTSRKFPRWGETPDQPDPTWLISEDDMAEALLSLKKLGDLPNKIHPARALKRAEVEYKLNKLDDERVFALAKFFGCHSASTRRRYRRHQGRHWHARRAALAQRKPVRVRRARHLAQQLPGLEVDAIRREVQAVHQETRIGASPLAPRRTGSASATAAHAHPRTGSA